MLSAGVRLFTGTLAAVSLRRRRVAAVLFGALWFVSVLAGMHSPLLVLTVEALTLFHTTVSLAAGVIGPAAVSGDQNQVNNESGFPFGLTRLSVVIRFGACVFLVFGCVTALVETVHQASHHHIHHLGLPVTIAVLHLVLSVLFRQHVLATDRVIGRHVTSAPSAVEDDEAMMCAPSDVAVGSLLTGTHGASTNARRRAGKFHGMTLSDNDGHEWQALFLLLGVPSAALLCEGLVSVTGKGWFDVAISIAMAALLLYQGLRQGSHTLWWLLNNPVRDLAECEALEVALREVRSVNGVLQVYSANMWRIDARDAMVTVRLRIAATANPATVSRAARQCLQAVATYVYVECALPSEPFPSTRDQEAWHEATHDDDAHDHTHSHGVHAHTDHGHAHGTCSDTATSCPDNHISVPQRSTSNPYNYAPTAPIAPPTTQYSGLPPPPSFSFTPAVGGNPYVTPQQRHIAASHNAAARDAALPTPPAVPNVYTSWSPYAKP